MENQEHMTKGLQKLRLYPVNNKRSQRISVETGMTKRHIRKTTPRAGERGIVWCHSGMTVSSGSHPSCRTCDPAP